MPGSSESSRVAMLVPARVLLLALPLLVLGACPVEVPAVEQVEFSCDSTDDCAPGYDCVQGSCQAEGVAQPRDASMDDGNAADGATLDGSTPDGSSADGSSADGSPADVSPADASPSPDVEIGDAGAADGLEDAALPQDAAPEDTSPCTDTDGDGICDADDRCPGADDRLDIDDDGAPDGCDCAALDPAIFPGAAEVCANFKDDDCSGTVDDGSCGVGCADGEREGFVDTLTSPDIAGCAGGWSIPGVIGNAPPACARLAGDDSANPNGDGCVVADLCAPGWHVCAGAGDVDSSSPTGCVDATRSGDPPLLFVTRQSGDGLYTCGSSGSNDVFGCGNQGYTLILGCGVLNTCTGDLCSFVEEPPWDCGADARDEASNLSKSGPSSGGVLCCRDAGRCGGGDDDRDGLGNSCDPCPLDPNNDVDGDGYCANLDICPQHHDPAQDIDRCLGKTCLAILEGDRSVGNGIYQIDPDDAGGQPPFPVLCNMTHEGGGWTLVGRELPENTDTLRYLGVERGTPLLLALGDDGLIGRRLASLYSEAIVAWGGSNARFQPTAELFENSVATSIPLNAFQTNDPTLQGWVTFAGGAHFCRAAADPDDRPGDSSWAIKPSDDNNSGCGCNSTGWAGRGAYYSGSPEPCTACTCWGPGGFTGIVDDGDPKSGVSSIQTTIWVR